MGSKTFESLYHEASISDYVLQCNRDYKKMVNIFVKKYYHHVTSLYWYINIVCAVYRNYEFCDVFCP